ncbi:hypothetical protein [Rhodococcus marinonascens]|uniref:hypothetical protein n=1 Tax=Rhodococcus marinonascens TaxID=38311 RepID=UPI0009335E28|nr:hypothetical protein [Rhodococcus marinonascens]
MDDNATAGSRKAGNKARRRKRRADRALCPPAVANKLGLRVADLAAAKSANGFAEPLVDNRAKRWLDGTEPMPQWSSGLLSGKAVRSAENQSRNETRRVEEEHRELLQTERVQRNLESGKTHFRGADPDLVADIAFEAAKDLARGATADDLSIEETTALRAVGVNPRKHSTWQMHAGKCEGRGDSCIEGAALHAAEIFEQQDALRQARREFVAVSEAMIADGTVRVGDIVQLGSPAYRVGTIVSTTRSRVKVRIVGFKQDSYEVIEKSMYPQWVRAVPEVRTPEVGEQVRFQDWGRHHRQGTVTEVDGSLFSAGYVLASKAPRSAWFDGSRLLPQE